MEVRRLKLWRVSSLLNDSDLFRNPNSTFGLIIIIALPVLQRVAADVDLVIVEDMLITVPSCTTGH